ncbi:lipopolysaccharide export system permease protein [Catalinimonas alkaloidigena]|uniref:Lipopolysaccharide export system permease protein n=1 Tax=Catalinimonas alkaloidigena TaxID=1075417 RepID=A0A1G9K2N5_9BACT|nr:LptF/LptG family permease [Catalinimonas alkaloidigena]SDL44170.1 lipopolysaccharide export system permease protein [Catalinimonas alkaloidigena]
MKKLDQLIIRSFLGPFFLTFAVVEFILLTQFLIKYLDYFVGKDLGPEIFAQLISYFALTIAPTALPLAVLLSSLMTFGNLGEHRELTAIKSAGISLLRVLRPVGVLVLLITLGSFFYNNTVLPWSNLKAFSLLYDIRQKKPSFDIKEGVFYDKIPNYRIKINKKYPDGRSIADILIYDHTEGRGNNHVILADSGQMYNIMNDRYLVLELYHGNDYQELLEERRNPDEEYVRNEFDRSKMIFDLSSFNLSRTDEGLFASNKIMRTVPELRYDIDSMHRSVEGVTKSVDANIRSYYLYNLRNNENLPARAIPDTAWIQRVERRSPTYSSTDLYSRAINQARSIRSFTQSYRERYKGYWHEITVYNIEIHSRYTQAVSCLILFLIGAPLGAIIKKGGFGIPVLISIIFFIVLYVLTILGKKWANEHIIPIAAGMWTANFVLFWVGLFFLRQARNDSALLDSDLYVDAFKRLFRWLRLRPAKS